MGTVIALNEFQRARANHPRPAPEPPPYVPLFMAAAHLFVAAGGLTVAMSLIPARIACAALTPWRS